MKSHPPARALYPLLLLFLVLTAAIAGVAWQAHVAQRDAVAQQVRKQLSAIAEAKTQQIAAWRADRIGQARVILESGLTLEGLERLVAGRSPAREKAILQAWMAALARELHYAGIVLADRNGRLIAIHGRVFGGAAHLSRLAAETAAAKDIVFTDVHSDEANSAAHIGLNIPLRLAPGEPAFGALLASFDPKDELFAIVSTWPAAVTGAEALLVWRDSGRAVFPTTTADGPVLRDGGEGARETVDNRGRPVFAAVKPAPGTSWRVVAKIDADEVLAPLRQTAIELGGAALLLILAASAITLLLWRRQQLRFYRAAYESELERRCAAERYETERQQMNEELNRAVEALQGSESRFRGAFEQAAVGMVLAALDGALTRVNDRYCQITGYTRDELLGRRAAEFTHPDDRAFDAAWIAAVRSGEEPAHRWEKRYIRKDGAVIRVAVTGSLLRGREGEPLGFCGVIEDVTAPARDRAALRQSEERFRQVVEHAPEGILVVSGTTIRYANPAAVRMLGAESSASLIGSSCLDRVHPGDREEARRRLEAVGAGREAAIVEQRNVRLGGEDFPAEVSAAAIAYDGQPAALIFFRDVTERKRAEEERERLEQRFRQAQKMESVGRLAGGVAHDFNNHLTVINGYCDMLLDALAPDDPLREEIDEIRAAGDRAAALTRQLLAFSRRQIAEPRAISLNGVVEEYSRLARRVIGDDIEIAAELDPELGTVLADRGQMHQVLMNLAVNARDAMPEGGALTLSTANIDLSAAEADDPHGPYVMLSVRDTGVGMSPEVAQQIFEPFFTTKPLGVGTGLGLATVYGIVEQSGGFIRVESEAGKGTTFRIYLPRIARAPEAISVRAPAAAPRGAETILVVEDQADVRKVATGVLRRAGYTVLEAANGADALALAESFGERIHLLVTDVIMPGMTGRELAERLRGARPATRVLYISGYAADVIAREGVLALAVGYLPKPFTPSDLAAKVREALDPAPSGRILVIDGDPAVRDLLSQSLAQAGYEVMTAANGEEGLRVAETGVELVITDMSPARRDGMETLKSLRGRFPDLRIIAVSAAFEGEFLKAAGAAGAQAAFVKPLDAGRIIPAVRELLG